MDSGVLRAAGVLLLAVIAMAQNPVVTITEPQLPEGINTFTALAGSMVDIMCVVRNKPGNRLVTWEMIRGNSTKLISRDVAPKEKMYSVIKPNSISWKLRIKNVQESMNGAYICLVQHSSFSETKDVIHMKVIKKPRINNLLSSKDKSVIENEPLTLKCDAEGIPPPVIKWMRLALADLPGGGKELRKKELTVSTVRAEHRGKYICQADNIAGRSRRVINVQVKFRPIIKPQHTVVYQKLGYAAMMMCDIEAFPPPTAEQISWTTFGESVAVETDDNFMIRTSLGANDRVTTRLYIKEVRQEDIGKYQCGAGNNRGFRKSTIDLRSTNVKQKEPPVDIYSSSPILSSSLFVNLLLCVLYAVFKN